MTLKELLDAESVGRKIHISVHDVSGILEQPDLRLDFNSCIHSCPFCSMAKQTPAGYETCISHKERVNRIAVHRRRAFYGMCPYGLCEAVYPVIIDGRVVCIVYIGNICSDTDLSRRRLYERCEKTGADSDKMALLLNECERCGSEAYLPTAGIIGDFIRNAADSRAVYNADNLHRAVRRAAEYAQQYYTMPISITQAAALCSLNPKYLGRIFKRQEGISYSGYINRLRMTKAAKLLRESPGLNITEAALESGYGDITYFNRVFRRAYGCSPSEYRKKSKT